MNEGQAMTTAFLRYPFGQKIRLATMIALVSVASLAGCGDNNDASTAAAALEATPSALAFAATGTTLVFIASEPGYTGSITANASNCASLALVSSASGVGPTAVFDVTALAIGQCVVTLTDANGHGGAVTIDIGPTALPALASSPITLSFNAAANTQSFVVRESNYAGVLAIDASECAAIASVSPSSATGPSAVFVVSSVAAGQCLVKIADSNGQVTAAALDVTTTTATLVSGYVPEAARSISIAINGGDAQLIDLPASPIAVAAPVGDDLFEISLFDETGGLGNVLARTNVSQTITRGTANVIAASPNGVVDSLAVSLSDQSPNAGAPADITVSLTAFDADGNEISGVAFTSPITLDISETSPSGTLSLSTHTLQRADDTATLAYTGGTLTAATIVASTTGASAQTTFDPTPTFYEIPLPTASAMPAFIALGPDGNMWATEGSANAIARITPAGFVTEFAVPTAHAEPDGITAASDGRLWFTESGSNELGAITTSGAFTEFATPARFEVNLIMDRGDGTVWYTADGGSSLIGDQDIVGLGAASTPGPTFDSSPAGIVAGPDNNVYFTETGPGGDKIARTANMGSPFSELALTTGSEPELIVRAPDGDLWFTEAGASKVGRISPTSFSVTGEFATPTPNAIPYGITVGVDSALWFTEYAADRIARITADGAVTEFKAPTTGLGLLGIASAPDGSLWFCELNNSAIGHFVY